MTTAGEKFEAFPSLIAPGESDHAEVHAVRQGHLQDLRPGAAQDGGEEVRLLTTSDLSDETPFLFNAPNYLIDLTKLVKQNKKADLMVIRANFPYDQFDPDDDYEANQQWRLITYNWTDQNHDGRLWRDKDHDGTVDNTPSDETNHDGDPIPDFANSEIQGGEYERFTYINQSTNAFTNMVRVAGSADEERPVHGLLPHPDR